MPDSDLTGRHRRPRRATIVGTIAAATSALALLAVTHQTWRPAPAADPQSVRAPLAWASSSPALPSLDTPDIPKVAAAASTETTPTKKTLAKKPAARKPRFKVVFRDNFTGKAGKLPSAKKWLFDLGTSYPGGAANWGTGEIQTYTKKSRNISLDGKGHLRITPRRGADGVWTSARIESRRADFKAPKNGVLRVEARIKLPSERGANLAGYWPAFWMLGAPFRGNYQNWPSIGELDVMENVNATKDVFGTLHCGVNPGGPCNETTGLAKRTTCGSDSCRRGFHTYAIEWQRVKGPDRLRWYVDGVRYNEVLENQVPAPTWAEFTSHKGYFLLLNVAMGGAFPAAIDPAAAAPGAATTSGRPLVVDFVKVSVKRPRK